MLSRAERQLAWAELHMPALMEIRKELSKKKPLKGLKIAAVLHVTKETGVLAQDLEGCRSDSLLLQASNPIVNPG